MQETGERPRSEGLQALCLEDGGFDKAQLYGDGYR